MLLMNSEKVKGTFTVLAKTKLKQFFGVCGWVGGAALLVTFSVLHE